MSLMIKCQKCSHDNQMGAIFCRNCGEKLDLDAFEPKTSAAKKNTVTIAKFIRKAVMLLILLAIILLLVGIFVPYGFKQYGPYSAQDFENAETKKLQIEVASKGKRQRKFTLSPTEATVLYNFILTRGPDTGGKTSGEKAKSGGNLVGLDLSGGSNAGAKKEAKEGEKEVSLELPAEQNLVFDVDSNGYACIIVNSKVYGAIPMRFELKGFPESAEDGSISFKIGDAKVGHVPVPGPLRDKVADKFEVLLTQNAKDFLSKIQKIEIDDQDNFVISVKPSKK